jgi:membrane-associated phospholipid phosphatase
MSAIRLANTLAVTATSLCLAGCASGRKPARPMASEDATQAPSASAPGDIQFPQTSSPHPRPESLAQIPDRSILAAPGKSNSDAVVSLVGTNVSPAPYVERLFSKEYGLLLYEDTKEVFTAPGHWGTREWAVFGGLSATVVGLTFADRAIRNHEQSHLGTFSDTVAKELAPLGAEYSFGALGAFYLAGIIWDNPNARAVTHDGLAASLITSAMIIPAMKYTFGRARPDQDRGSKDFDPFNIGQSSFPSGHTAQAFTVATVIAEHYDSWWVKGVSYGAASLVGWARVHKDRHFASDCFAGAVIGTFVGHTVVKYNQRHRAGRAGKRATVTPFYDGQATGLALDYQF